MAARRRRGGEGYGAAPAEIAVMETLTANLHFILSAFYRPQKEGRHKIIIESKAFPSDHVSTPPYPYFLFHTGIY
jgi:kynureninase